jgi:acyl carrier protein
MLLVHGRHRRCSVYADRNTLTVQMTLTEGQKLDLVARVDSGMHEKIWEIIEQHGRLPVETGSLSDDSDLYAAGMTSHASVNVMLALEDAFDVEFPDHMLKRSVFSSVSTIGTAVQEIQTQQVA